MMELETLARQLRLAVITNLWRQGLLEGQEARDLLRAPLSLDDESTFFDDSSLLGDPDGLEKLERVHKKG